jgi:hypothetical protein
MAKPGMARTADRAGGRSYSRVPVAVALGLLGLAGYIVAAVSLADPVLRAPWPVQTAYFVVAGSVWVLPVRWLMLWAARLR